MHTHTHIYIYTYTYIYMYIHADCTCRQADNRMQIDACARIYTYRKHVHMCIL